jgi:hypothetical protein
MSKSNGGASYPDLKIGASAVSSAERFGAVERIEGALYSTNYRFIFSQAP